MMWPRQTIRKPDLVHFVSNLRPGPFMQFSRTVLGLVFVLVPATQTYADDELPARTVASQEAIRSLAGTLKEHLSTAIAAGGVSSAIEVCNLVAPEIAQAESLARGWKTGRTSLKVRNPANTPDSWELEVLKRFEARKAAGAEPETLDHAEIVSADGLRSFRYMKAIVTMPVCLNCHGSSLAPDVAARLDDLYPEDQARGYAVGDLRGAFTVVQPLE